MVAAALPLGPGADRFHIEDAYGNADQFNRVWPAFGQRGGALETVLTQGTLPEPEFNGVDGAAIGG